MNIVRKLIENYKIWGNKVNFRKTYYISCERFRKYIVLIYNNNYIKIYYEFEYFGIKTNEKAIQGDETKRRIYKGLFAVSTLWN